MPDAHLVSLMRQHGARRIYSRDIGLRRYAYVDWSTLSRRLVVDAEADAPRADRVRQGGSKKRPAWATSSTPEHDRGPAIFSELRHICL